MKRSSAILVPLFAGALAVFFLPGESRDPDSAPAPEHRTASEPKREPPLIGETPAVTAMPGESPMLPSGRPPREAGLAADFLDRAVDGETFRLGLPDGRQVTGVISQIRHDAKGVLSVLGRFDVPEPGRFYFQRQTAEGVAGALVGHVLFDRQEVGWKVMPEGPRGAPQLVETPRDNVLCVNYTMPPPAEESEPEEVPQAHPLDIPLPAYQAIVPLQSLPGATGVIYLDFDGEAGPFSTWGDFDAAPSTVTNSQVHAVWRMVSEDYQGFNLNITTDRKVFDAAPPGRRQHVVITPTANAAPNAGGVAYVGSFNWSESSVCWAFYSTGKSAAEVISHEVGHTLGLSHDGRISPNEGYYRGHGEGSTGWAPIMGVGYYETLSQWSKGEYLSASQTQDDLAILSGSNNDVGYRADDTGQTLATARYLEIAENDTVANEGIIERTGDIDAFRFATTGGAVSLSINTVTSNPNLDIMAELVDAATGEEVDSDNPDLAINANLSVELPAGEYLLKIRGTGRGDPLDDGYTDYGSLGSYLIGGSMAGGVKPERFTVAENSAAGVTLGTVAARGSHGGAALTWSIASGNSGGAFAINPANGALTVSNPAVLNYEALSLRWDDPSTIELFVTIADSLHPVQNESLRVVVTVSDVNEAPSVTGGSVTMLERTRAGTPLLTLSASDGDRFDFPVFSISAGNANGWFAIDPGTGELRVNGSIEISGNAVLPVTVKVTDKGTPALFATAIVNVNVVNIAAGYQPGGVMRTYFEGILGSSVSNLTNATTKWPNSPDSEELLPAFDGDGHGDSFGSTVRGYVIPPVSGSYRFWISSDDASQLFLSSSASPSVAPMIASVGGSTERYSWPDGGGQQSGLITLTAGQPYYIEARHKESGGGDHVAVAWSGPGISKQLLPGLFLAPYDQNYAPKVLGTVFSVPEEAFAGQIVGTVTVTDVNAEDDHGSYAITSGNEDGAFAIDPVTGELRVANAVLSVETRSAFALTIQVTDTGTPAQTGSGTVTVNVLPAGTFADNGIFQQIWPGIAGSQLSALTADSRYPLRPVNTRTLASFDSGANFSDSYGSRVRALLVPPVTGNYTFFLASDDESRLLLGSSASPASATQIASVTGSTARDEWGKFASQQSTQIYLLAGQPYYIEALHKESSGVDHLQVGWIGPGIFSVTIVPGSALQPYDLNTPPYFGAGGSAFTLNEGAPNGTLIGVATATDPEGESPVYAILEELIPGAFAINSKSGLITVANTALMSPGVHHITVAAQDRGIGGLYPLRTGAKSIAITVKSNNQAPVFPANSFTLAATEDLPFTGTLSATDPDAGDTLTVTKVSGPAWLSVSPGGGLSGTPGQAQVGPNHFTLRVADDEGLFDEATLTIIVANVNDLPVFLVTPLDGSPATEDLPYSGSLAGSASDPDAGDSVGFSKISGPAWLSIAPQGTLSGTPRNADVGENAFVIRVTDLAGAYSETSLQVTVANTNDPPSFSAPSFAMPDAAEDQPYIASLLSFAGDPDAGDGLSFSKVDGPGWLVVSPDGSIWGTPENGDVGSNSFTVRVTDLAGTFDDASLTIAVVNANDAPEFAFDPILRPGGREGEPYSAPSLTGTATDPDAGEIPIFSKEAGPVWLVVATDGTLSGTPPEGSAGLNAFTVRATDPGGAFREVDLWIEIATAGIPLPWEDATLGAGLAGSASQEGEGIHLTGTGQLTGRNDAFHFAWQPLSTDGSITARIDSMESTGPASLAGVMIRDTLASNSRHVFMGMTADGGFRWVRRTGYNGNTSTNTSGNGVRPDAWVRLVRSGDVITAFKSLDGSTWITVGSLTAPFPPTCYFGLAVASGNAVDSNTAAFSEVSLSP